MFIERSFYFVFVYLDRVLTGITEKVFWDYFNICLIIKTNITPVLQKEVQVLKLSKLGVEIF